MPDPLRCAICGGPITDDRDPAEQVCRPRKYCGPRCKRRAGHRREYRRDDPDLARQTECERKLRYASQPEAEVVRSRMAVEDGRERAVYGCPWCGGWHLGSYARPEGGEPG